MPPFLRSPAAIIAGALVVVAMAVIGFLPLFGGPGYESALAAGIVLPFAVGIATALESASSRPEPFEAYCRGVANGAAFAAAAWLTTLVHGLRVGFCDALQGSALFALGPGAGALLAGVWGALAGEIARSGRKPWSRRTLAVLLASAGPLVSIGLSVSRFYSSPMVFAYDPFVGYFSGTLYDTVIDASALVTYRAGTAASLFAAMVVALHLAHDGEGRLAFQAIGRPGLLVAGVVALVGSITTIVKGNRLGHWQTPETISTELGALVTGDRCDVVYPRSMRLAEAQRFARDCDAHVAALEKWLDAKGPPKVTAYLFADARQKDALMGAAETQIAKPWRREIYLQNGPYPHHSLGHELAHVLAGQLARGPFQVAGSWGGWVPNPGLIEGLAVAASPRDGDMSPAEWAKAMKDLEILPPLERLFGMSFLGENSSTAYTASGAFVGWVHDRFGAEMVKNWYAGSELPKLVGQSWAELEKAWRQDLDKIELPEAARAQARARFDRPAIFGRRCPHVVDECRMTADAMREAGDVDGAIAKYGEILALDPHDGGVRIAIARATARGGKVADALKALEQIAADEALPRHVRDRAVEELGDQALVAGEGDAATARYRDVMSRIVDEDQLRTLDVKIVAAGDARARDAVVPLLVGARGKAPDRFQAAEQLGAWSALEPDDGLPDYLLARQHLGAGELEEAAAHLDRALSRRLDVARVQVEAERLRLVAACGLGDAATAQRMYAAYAARPVSQARRDAARSR